MKNKTIISIILIIILILTIFLGIFRKDIIKLFYPKPFYEIVSTYSKEYDVDENLIYAVMKAESNFDERAVSNKSALGLMQIMEETARDVVKKHNINIKNDITKEEMKDIKNNINIGTKYLSILLDRYKNIPVSIAAYNAGIGTVDNWIEKGIINKDGSNIEKIPYKETNNYVRKTIRNYKEYEKIYKTEK